MLRSAIVKVGCFELLGGRSIIGRVYHWYNGQSFLLPACGVSKSSVTLDTLEKHLDEECSFRQDYLTTKLMSAEKETTEFLENNPHLLKMKRHKFTKMIDLFAMSSITWQDVLTYPGIFKRKYETVKVRIDDLKQNTDLKSVRLSMINVSQKDFHRRYETYVEDTNTREEFRDKCGLLIVSLRCSETVAASLIKSSKWLDNSKLSTIRKKLDLYLSMEPELATIIKRRIWLLTFPVPDIEAKLNDLKRLEIPIFIWQKSLNRIMKSTDEEYNAILQRMVLDRSIYNDCTSKKEFLCKQLECSESDLKLMNASYPHLLSVNIVKLQSHLSLLRGEFRFSNTDIIENPRVFKFSEETLQLRFHELQTFGPSVPSLPVMIRDGKKYTEYIDKLKESFI